MTVDGPGREKKRLVRVVEGKLRSSVTVVQRWLKHIVVLNNTPGVDGVGVQIENDIDLTNYGMNNREVAMRISSDVASGEIFFTDLNGFQVAILSQLTHNIDQLNCSLL